MHYHIAATVATLLVLGLMLWDQTRLKQMSVFKWYVWFLLLAVMLGNIWVV